MNYALRLEPRDMRRKCNGRPLPPGRAAEVAAVSTGRDGAECERIIRSLQHGQEITILPPRQVENERVASGRLTGKLLYCPMTVTAHSASAMERYEAEHGRDTDW